MFCLTDCLSKTDTFHCVTTIGYVNIGGQVKLAEGGIDILNPDIPGWRPAGNAGLSQYKEVTYILSSLNSFSIILYEDLQIVIGHVYTIISTLGFQSGTCQRKMCRTFRTVFDFIGWRQNAF